MSKIGQGQTDVDICALDLTLELGEDTAALAALGAVYVSQVTELPVQFGAPFYTSSDSTFRFLHTPRMILEIPHNVLPPFQTGFTL